MTEESVRIILRDDATPDDVDDALFALGCRMINVVIATEHHPGQMIFATSDRAGVIHLVQDGRLGVRYLAGQGVSASWGLAKLAQSLPCWEVDAILSLQSSDDANTRSRAPSLAVFAGPDIAESVLRAALADPSSIVRNAALLALSYSPTAELGVDLQRLAADDPDEMVRFQAQKLVEALFSTRSTP